MKVLVLVEYTLLSGLRVSAPNVKLCLLALHSIARTHRSANVLLRVGAYEIATDIFCFLDLFK